MEFLKKIKKSDVYEMIKDQSGLIIFVLTLIGSFLALSTQISDYFYSLGKFFAYNIPIHFIEIESFSVFHIVKVFACILCYVGGTAIFIYTRMSCKTRLSIAKMHLEFDENKKKYRKNIAFNLFATIIMSVCILIVNSLLVIMANPKTFYTIILLLLILMAYQWFYSGMIIKDVKNKISEEKSHFDESNEDNKKYIDKICNLSSEEYMEHSKQVEYNYKTIRFTMFLLPFVFVIIYLALSCAGNYISGMSSATNEDNVYQIISLSDKDYVVLEKVNDDYILSEAVISEENKILNIKTNYQLIVPIEDHSYKLEYFDKVVLA